LGLVVVVVVGDLNGEGVIAVEVCIWCVGPSARGGIDGSGAVGGIGADGEAGVCSAVSGIGEGERACDGGVVLITGLGGITIKGAGVIELVDGDTDGGCFCDAAGGDGVGEGIRAVEVFVGCVFQGACIGINDFNGAIGALGDR